MAILHDNELDDFPISPQAIINSTDFYESFLQCEELVKNIPKKQLGENTDETFYNLLQEVHSANSGKSALFRRKVDASEALSMLWLSRVRATAQLFVAFNEIPLFNELTESDLSNFSKLSKDINNLHKLADTLLEFGIILIYEPSIPKMKLDGAVFNLRSGRPVIALSLRFPQLDKFWFSLMHELAHIVLHYEKLSIPILDDMNDIHDDIIEKQADKLATNSLISRSDWRSSIVKYSPSEKSIKDFAKQVGIHPSIVAGRLQKESNQYAIFSKIVNEVNVREVLFSHE
jgi:HTH-type transcriptional regulator/antitoxin HigA